MIPKTVTTKAEGFEYEVTVNLPESLDEARGIWEEAGENADEVIFGTILASWEQNAKQGAKNSVRDAIRSAAEKGLAPDEADEVTKAVQAHREYASEYVLGAPRGGHSGAMKIGDAKEIAAAAARSNDPEALAMLEEIKARLGL